MVPTPHALAVRAEVSAVVERARALFAPGRDADLRTVQRTLTIIGHDAVPAACGAALFARAAEEAPGIRIRFLAESHVDAPVLREGTAEVPLKLPPLHLGLAWHPRHDADPAHAWLRRTVRELLAQWSAGRA